jgi:predicted ATPase
MGVVWRTPNAIAPMSERLIIHNFAGIESLTIELRRINILIGRQASGKSICAKLCYFFKDVHKEMVNAIGREEDWNSFSERMSKTFNSFFSFEAWQGDRSSIRYELDEHWVTVGYSHNQSATILFSPTYQAEFERLKVLRNQPSLNPYGHDAIREQRALLEDSSSHMGAEFVRDQVFVPAGRSFFSVLQINMFSLMRAEIKLDPFLLRFGQTYENIRDWLPNLRPFFRQKSSLIEPLVSKILTGKYVRQNGKDYLENPDGRLIEVAMSSSGQQEALPMVIVLEGMLGTSTFAGSRTIYVEEPEAHLFPDTQRDVVNLIAAVFKQSEINLQFFITTHSPYVLTAFNNLLQAGELHSQPMEELDRRKLEDLIPEALALSVEDFAAYSLANGTATSLISEEFGLIDTNIIDDVSNELSIEFGELLDLVP